MSQTAGSPIKINIKAIVNERLGAVARVVPHFLIRKLENLICQERLNALLEHNFPMEGADFCRGVLSDLNVNVEMVNADRLPPVSKRRVIIVSNHPLGGLDGMALIDYFTRRYGGQVKFIVNDLLMAVKPLAPVFLPINKHGHQSRASLTAIDQVMK
ncbi:MAG: glycerol acyltransferase, partial [Muribaculaceae bacterium]|nr:glycerol acyltransferase [Muribaculaceae bacterium]